MTRDEKDESVSMSPEVKPPVARRYLGFISYSQKDKAKARRLHKALEAYRIPKTINDGGTKLKKHRLGRFFRDDDELGAASDLGATLRGAIEDSESLIVVCSPHAARSIWVNKEVIHFKVTGRDDRIFAIIVGGQPNAETRENECFPPALRFEVEGGSITDRPAEPMAIDIRKQPFARAIVRLVAGLLDVRFDSLWLRERRRRRRNRALAMVGVALGGFVVFSSIKVYQNTTERLETTELARKISQIAPVEGDRLRQDERAALLARQAYLFDQIAGKEAEAEIDTTLRRVVDKPYFGVSLHENPLNQIHGLTVLDAMSQLAYTTQRSSGSGLTGAVYVREAGREASPKEIYAHKKMLRTVKAAKTGNMFISATKDGVLLRHERDGNGTWVTEEIAKPANEISEVDISASGDLIVWVGVVGATSGRVNGDIGLWRRTAIRDYSGHTVQLPRQAASVALSPDERYLAVGDNDGRFWLSTTKDFGVKPLRQFAHPGVQSDDRPAPQVGAIRFHPDGERFVTGDSDGRIYLWSLDQLGSGEPPEVFFGHRQNVLDLEFSPDGQFLASSSFSGWINVWRVDEPFETVARLHGHSAWASDIAFSKNGRQLFSGGTDGVLRQWIIDPIGSVIEQHEGMIWDAVFVDDDTVMSSGRPKGVNIWSLNEPAHKRRRDLMTDRSQIGAIEWLNPHQLVAFRSNNDILLTPASDGGVQEETRSFSIDTGFFTGLTYSKNLDLLAAGTSEGDVLLWQPDAFPEQLHRWKPAAMQVQGMAFSPKTKELAISGSRGVQVWDVSGAEPALVFENNPGIGVVGSVIFSHDGGRLIAGGVDGVIRTYAYRQTPSTPDTIRAFERFVMDLARSPDGKLLAAAGGDQRIRIWELDDLQRPPKVLAGHRDRVTAVAFSPSGAKLVSSSDDGTVRVWPILTSKLADHVCKIVRRNLTATEWSRFVGDDRVHECTCPNMPPSGRAEVCKAE
ncbi:MAG: TIR domain-containing protein [Pseudomonadota bacterium]